MDDIPFAADDSGNASDIIEESLIREDYENDNLASNAAKADIEARDRQRFGIRDKGSAGEADLKIA